MLSFDPKWMTNVMQALYWLLDDGFELSNRDAIEDRDCYWE